MYKILSFLFCFSSISSAQNIGDFTQGGIVFYLDSLGKGLIVDTAYLEASYPWSIQNSMISDWGPYAQMISGTEHSFIGAGHFNTSNFTSIYPDSHYPMNLVNNSSSGGYTDWFLPSKDELWELMQKTQMIDSVIDLLGGDVIDPNFHWSSTHTFIDSRYAWGVLPYTNMLDGTPNGPIFSTNSTNMPYLVHAIRCIDNDCDFVSTPTFGCTDSIAENYNIDAEVNDGNCMYINGCTDTASCNFNFWLL